MWRRLANLIVLLALAVAILPGQEAAQHLLSQDEVYRLIKQDKGKPDVLEKSLHDQGVDFDLNSDIEKKMRKAGATDEILQAIWAAGPTVRNFKGATLLSATGAPLTSTYKEAMGYETLEQTSDPDTKIIWPWNSPRPFPRAICCPMSSRRPRPLSSSKGDYQNAAKTGERSLELDPDNTYSLLIVATALSEPSMVRKAGDNRSKVLAGSADGRPAGARPLAQAADARPDETPEQLEARKAGIESSAYAALGSVAMQQDKYDEASKNSRKPSRFPNHPRLRSTFASEKFIQRREETGSDRGLFESGGIRQGNRHRDITPIKA